MKLQLEGWPVMITSRRIRRVARLLDMLLTAWRLRSHYQVAVVDLYSGLAFLWSEAVCRLLQAMGKPYILTLHGGNLPAFSEKRGSRIRRHLEGAVAVTAPSAYMLHRMRAYRSGLQLLPNPIDLCNYQFHWRERARPRLVWLRAFHRIYNPELAPKVIAILRHYGVAATLVMAGPDKGDGSLQRSRLTAQQLGVEDSVQFVGSVPKAAVPAWLQRGDIFLNTTGLDNTPVSVLEAMACGLCVVSTNVGGIPYLLADEHDSLLVPPNDPEAMAAAVRRLLDRPELASQLSANARRKVERFDWSHVLPEWLKLLRFAAGRGQQALAKVS
jgi:glycosyltransferase involved in cell wall biosynthesis